MLLGKAAILKTPARRVGVIIRRHIFIPMAVLGFPSRFPTSSAYATCASPHSGQCLTILQTHDRRTHLHLLGLLLGPLVHRDTADKRDVYPKAC